MDKQVTDFGHLSKREIIKSLRDGVVFIAAAAVTALIAYLQGLDLSVFGEYEMIASGVITAFVIPLLNRLFNIGRVE